MAADQRKKRFDSARTLRSAGDLYKAKRKKLGYSQHDLDMKTNISLEWDGSRKSVVAKREQIGISWRDLTPFVDDILPGHNTLADVITVPREVFALDDLAHVLTFEVWKTCLSDNERSLLTQFLPKCPDPGGVVQQLLEGDNFHFGNPFLKWGALLCTGNFHPDNVLYHEQCSKASKKAYYSELQMYHTDMIENLQMWKERFVSCKDSEDDIIQLMWRSRKKTQKHVFTSEPGFHDLEEYIYSTPESSCRATSEKVCSSDYPNGILMLGELWQRKGSTTGKVSKSSDGLKALPKDRKGEKLLKRNIQHGDGAKYMSYIKVSKTQHQQVKSTMKHNSSSIQPKSLNSVLGNIDAFHVQPFKVYEEEERQKLHEHWLQLANGDLPTCVSNWRNRQLQRLQITKSLGREIEQNLKSQKESIQDEEENSYDMVLEQLDNEDTDAASRVIKEAKVAPGITEEEAPTLTEEETPKMNVEDEEQSDGSIVEQMDSGSTSGGLLTFEDEEREKSVGDADISPKNEHIHQAMSLNNGCHHFDDMNIETLDDLSDQKKDRTSADVLEYPANLKSVDVPLNQDDIASAIDSWQQVGMHGPYYHSSSLNHGYSSVNELSLGHHQVEEQPSQLLNLGAVIGEKVAPRHVLQRHSGDMAYISPYPYQDRNELFQSIYKGENLPYQHEQKQAGLDFQPAANLMVETGQFPGPMREQLHSSLPLEFRQKGLNDFYLRQNIRESMYSDGGPYPIQRQENLALSVQDWAVNSVHVSAALQSQVNGGELLSQNWYSGSNQARGSWPCMEGAVGPSQNIGRGSSCDQNLFTVISECNELQPGAHYDTMSSSGRFVQAGNYGGVSGGINAISNTLPQNSNSHNNYISGHEISAGYKSASSLGWMNMQHQTPGLEETMGKAFLRSWNQ